MDDSQGLAAKLKSLLDTGKSQYEAAELLQQDGYSPAQIEDAQIALNSRAKVVPPAPSTGQSSVQDIRKNPELAKDLLEVTTAMSSTERRAKNPPGYLFSANGIPRFNVKVTGNIYWYFLVALAALAGLLLLVRRVVK